MMDATGLQILLLLGSLFASFLGLATAAQAVVRDFLLINELKTWSEAQAYCRDKYYDLATINTVEEQAKVTDMMIHSGHPDAWIGLYDESAETSGTWRWSLDNSLVTDRDPGNWFRFNPNKAKQTHACVYLFYGSLHQGRCESSYASACYDETSNSIYPNAQWMSWADAQAHCRETYTDLPSIKTKQDLTQIMNSVDQIGFYRWVGLRHLTWKWSEYDEADFTAWWPGEPDGDDEYCASAGARGWNSTACTELRPFICSGPPNRLIKVTLKTTSSVNMNDPLVQEAVLKKMGEDLRGKGVDPGLSLSWRKSHDGNVFNRTHP